jgi:hypothetical protein
MKTLLALLTLSLTSMAMADRPNILLVRADEL